MRAENEHSDHLDSACTLRQRRSAIRIGFLALLLVLAWMTVTAWQRPMSYFEARETLPWPDARIDLNTATEAELTVLPGIGPRLAERIVDDREAHGPFASLEELTRVPWIGPRTVEGIIPYADVNIPENDALAEHE